MANDIHKLLKDTGEITPQQAEIIASYVQTIEDPRGPEAQALIRSKRPGKDVTIRSVRAQNLIINWDKLLIAGVALLGGTAGAVAGGPIGILAAIGLCLTALSTLAPAASIELSDDHSRVVETLWREFESTNPVPSADLKRSLDGKVAPDDLESILDDLTILQVIEFDEHERIFKRERIFAL